MTERNRRAFPRYRCGGNEDFIYLCQTAEMPGGASRYATHLPAPFFGTYNHVCVSGMARRIRKAAAVRQRYNTLDFASKVVCQQGYYRPYWKPRAEGASISEAPSACLVAIHLRKMDGKAMPGRGRDG